MADKAVMLAAVSGAHGINGEVRLKLFGEGVAALKRYPSFNDGALTLKSMRSDNKGGAIARFAEVTDRNTAEKLRGTALSVSRELMPELPADEYYHADLIGLPAVDEQDQPLGKVVAVDNFGASDVIEVERPDGKKFMVPMTKDAVPQWNEAGITIHSAFIV
ncbi:ribosome maturation factor RimM [Altericroceibacterium endophyticum]|uniref:Ribosome maturation factor RimM n=1 Tax=Altericroceibacterium endophyticum TaxID=1808508 RepID=A0A6I4T2M2_9SPHN|nr:ribosome maturation factor RimM [Altericroceibacterium endophyticum]MXO64471.1 16S rRNA processing protein RimM [Altericroceibacterium endophyticum]